MGKVVEFFGSLDSWIDDTAPYGAQAPSAQVPGGLFQDAQNVIPYRGVLRNAWKWRGLTASTSVNPTVSGNIASRQAQEATNAQYVVDAKLISSSEAGIAAYMVLTDGEVFVNGTSCNPTYTTGTAACAASTTVTGTGTAWTTRGIKVGDIISFDSGATWYVISQVNGNTSITLASTGPNTGGAVSYTIRRTFKRGIIPGAPSWTVLNGDLYVACQCAGLDPAGVGGYWCILKVADVFSGASTATYIMSSWDTTGAIAAKSKISTITDLIGIQARRDGGLAILVRETAVGNRVRYSSLTDVTEWTYTPGGYVDLVGGDGSGRAFCRIGDAMVAYFADSIHVGHPTGQSDPPFNWSKSSAMVGTRWPRAVRETPYGNVFVGSDGNVWLFDGNDARKLTNTAILRWTSGPDTVEAITYSSDGKTASGTLSATAGTITVA